MISRITLSIILFVSLAFVMRFGSAQSETLYDSIMQNRFFQKTIILSVPHAAKEIRERVLLGCLLFHDENLSSKRNMSCAACHPIDKGGMDGKRFSTGSNGKTAGRNTPTLFNLSLAYRYGWTAKYDSLEELTEIILLNKDRIGGEWANIIRYLTNENKYAGMFKSFRDSSISKENVVLALTSYIRSLNTPDSPFDRFLKGDPYAVTHIALSGFMEFKNHGCIACHQGVLAGANMVSPIGVFSDFGENPKKDDSDTGLMRDTGKSEDKNVFRVPQLRNVAITPPYFHDGSAPELKDAVLIMGMLQLGYEMGSDEIDRICEFLYTLTGKTDGFSK